MLVATSGALLDIPCGILSLFAQDFAEDVVEDFPVLQPSFAVVTAETAAIHSAPDSEAYVTSYLKRGSQVEIYLEVDGWCAIRPPEGSFSWVSAQYVQADMPSASNLKKKNGKNVGTVMAEGLASRIGSEISPQGENSGTIQVKLRKGEKVFILGFVDTPENPQSPRWLKIAPPNGEYRWIRRDGLRDAQPRTLPPPLVQTTKTSPTRQAVYAGELPSTTASVSTEPVDSLDELRRSIALPDMEWDKEYAPLTKTVSLPPSQSSQPHQLRPVPPTAFQKTYEELKMATLSILTRAADDDEFTILIERASQLYREARTNEDLEKVFHLVESLQRAQLARQEIALQRGFQSSALLTPPIAFLQNSEMQAGTQPQPWQNSANAGAPLPRSMHTTASTATIANRDTVAFQPMVLHDTNTGPEIPAEMIQLDGMGRLGAFDDIPVGYPPYALVDDKQQVLCLLTPDKGLNLEPFVGQLIGVKGRREFYRVAGEADKRHITVLEAFQLKEPD